MLVALGRHDEALESFEGMGAMSAALRNKNFESAAKEAEKLVQKLAKDPEQAERLDAVLSTLILSARAAATLLLPIAPEAAAEILRQIGLEALPLTGEITIGVLPEAYCCGEPTPVFPRLELQGAGEGDAGTPA